MKYLLRLVQDLMYKKNTNTYKMFGIIKNIFSSEKTLETISKVVMTKEEQADIHVKMLSAYAPFKLTQRLMVAILVPPYALLFFLGGLAYLYNECFMHNEAIRLGLNNYFTVVIAGTFGTMIMMIMAFYFGGGFLEGTIKRYGKANSRTSAKERRQARKDKRLDARLNSE